MDAVIASEWFTPREVKRVNWCRLYLQVTLLSDITNVAGSHLDPNMIKGIVDHPKSSVTAGHRFVQDRPAQRVWSLWRKANLLWSNEHGKLRQPLGSWRPKQPALRSRMWPAYCSEGRVFVRNQQNMSQYTIWEQQAGTRRYLHQADDIAHSMIPAEAAPVEVRRQFPVGYVITFAGEQQPCPNPAPTISTTLQAFFESLEPWESELLVNNRLQLSIQDLLWQLDRHVVIVCDGSVNVYEAGSFGWIMSDPHGNRIARCSGRVRGSRLSSYRAEGYGMLSIVRFLTRVREFTNTTSENGSFCIACDNNALVRNVNKLIPSHMMQQGATTDLDKHDSLEALQPDWDVLHEIWHSIKEWRPFQVVHVKGHQDRTQDVTMLSLEAHLNVEADAEARAFLNLHPEPYRKCHMFPHTHAHLSVNNETITYRYPLRLRNAECDPLIERYLQDKHSWSSGTFNTINWKVHGMAIQTQRHRKLHTTKLVHDQLPVNKIQHRWNPLHSPHCPFCSTEVETRDHLLRCTQTSEWRSRFMQVVRGRCDMLRTDAGLKAVLLRGLQLWFEGHEVIPMDGYSADLIALIESQNAIGWRHLFNGRWSVHWSHIQSVAHGETTVHGVSPAGNKWNCAIIKEIWSQWHILWQLRNERVHGHDVATRRVAELDVLRRRMRNLYAKEGQVEPHVAEVLRIPIEEQLARGATYIANWLATHEPTILSSIRRANARATQGVRSIRSYFAGHIDDPG